MNQQTKPDIHAMLAPDGTLVRDILAAIPDVLIPITVKIINEHLDDFLRFAQAVLLRKK